MCRACPSFEIIYASIRISKDGALLLDSGLCRQPDLPNGINVLDLFECFGFVCRFADEWNGYLKTSKTFVFHKKGTSTWEVGAINLCRPVTN